MKPIFLVCLLCLVSACACKPETAADMLQREAAWMPVYVTTFSDGGSWTLCFLNYRGEVIHLWAQTTRFDATPALRRFFLKRFYNDPSAVEVLPGSAIEQRLLRLLDDYHPAESFTPASYPKHFAALLRDRRLPFPKDWTKEP